MTNNQNHRNNNKNSGRTNGRSNGRTDVRNSNGLQKAGDILKQHTIVVLNEALKHGFAQIPSYILCFHKLSFGARLTYAILLRYAWQEGSCFPGQEKIAVDLGVTRRSVSEYLVELKKHKFIDWKRRGMGKTNVYYILDYKPLKIEADGN